MENANSVDRLNRIRRWTVVVCSLGFMISYYAYFVETKAVKNPNYAAMCDLHEYISCTKVFKSKYGTGFGLLEHIVGKNSFLNQPNGVFGLIFYAIQLALGNLNSRTATKIQVPLAILSNVSSVYLAYILYILSNLCVVCLIIYALNAILLALSLRKLSVLNYLKQFPVKKQQ